MSEPKTKLLILDILKPHKPSILDFAKEIAKLGKDYSVNLRTREFDEKTETVEAIIKGQDLNYEKIVKAVEKLGGSVHSLDQANVGSTIVTPKDYPKEYPFEK